MLELEDVKRAAALSMLELSEEEMASYLTELDSIVNFAHQIEGAATEETTSGDDHEPVFSYREDTVRDSFPAQLIAGNAANQDFGYISVIKRGE